MNAAGSAGGSEVAVVAPQEENLEARLPEKFEPSRSASTATAVRAAFEEIVPTKLADQLCSIARRAASRVRVRGLDYEARHVEAFMAVWFNSKRVMNAHDPAAYAYSVAYHHLLKLAEQHKNDPILVSVSDMDICGEDDEELSDHQKLDLLSPVVDAPDSWTEFDLKIAHTAFRGMLRDLWECLAEMGATPAGNKKQMILKLFYGFYPEIPQPLPLDRIAVVVNLSIDRVKHVKAEALWELSRLLTARGYKK